MFFEFAPEDGLDGPLRVAEFVFFLGKAGVGDGSGGKRALLQPLTPVLGRAAAEAMAGAPRKVLLDGAQPKALEVFEEGKVALNCHCFSEASVLSHNDCVFPPGPNVRTTVGHNVSY